MARRIRRRDQSSTSRYLSGEGSLMLLESHPYALRYNRQGIALVSTDGIGNIPIAVENRPAGGTDEHGYLLLTDLPRYHNAKISLDPLSLPPEIATPIVEMHARPGLSTAVKVDFQVHRARTLSARFSTVAASRCRWAAASLLWRRIYHRTRRVYLAGEPADAGCVTHSDAHRRLYRQSARRRI